MTTSLLTNPSVTDRAARAGEPALERPAAAPPRRAPGLTVVLAPSLALPPATSVLRPGVALGLVPSFADPLTVSGVMAGIPMTSADRAAFERARESAADRAVETLTTARLAVHAVETIRPGDIEARLRALAGEDVSCIVVATRSARQARRLARAGQAPVLAVPPGSWTASGPAVLAADEASRVLPAAARCLTTEAVVPVAKFDPVPTGTLVRSAAHPLLVPRLQELAERHRWDALDAAELEAELAAVVAAEHGMVAEPAVVGEPLCLATLAAERDGVIVAADRGALRSPRSVHEALATGRPVLLVP